MDFISFGAHTLSSNAYNIHLFFSSQISDSQDEEPLNLSIKQNSPSTTPTINVGNIGNASHRSITSIWSPASLCEKESAENASTDIDSPCEDGNGSRSENVSPQPIDDESKGDHRDESSNTIIADHRYRLNYRRKSSDTSIPKFDSVKVKPEVDWTQAAVAASAVAAAAVTANPNFFHFHKQELDLMAKNHLDLFTINNNNDIEGPKISRDERKREQRCFQVSANC